MNKLAIWFSVALLVSLGIVACSSGPPPPYYQATPSPNEPVLNVDPSRHGNIARAQQFSRQAYDAMTAAQQANEFDLAGHAAQAKELLREANDEMKLAAVAANRR